MGSFDMTCVLSDVGISCGDKIAALFLLNRDEDSDHETWGLMSAPVYGTYDDYGRMTPDAEPTALIEHLKPWVVPMPGGHNSCHDVSIDTDNLSYDVLETANHERRLYVWRSPPTGRSKEAVPYWGVQKVLVEAGLPTKGSFEGEKEGYLYALREDGAQLHVYEFDWGTTARSPRVEEVRKVLHDAKYATMLIPSPNVGYKEGTPVEDYHCALLIAPALETGKIFLGYHGKERPRENRYAMRIGLVRQDVLDAVSPRDERLTRRATLLKNAITEHKELLAGLDPIHRCFYTQSLVTDLWRLGGDKWPRLDAIVFGEGSYDAHVIDHILPQLLALPDDTPVSVFEEWVRIADISTATRGWMRRGLRPPCRYVGSQCASEDWPKQKTYHEALTKVLADAIAESEAYDDGLWGDEEGEE